jgi:hypothetical protein
MVAAPSAGAASVSYKGSSADGKVVFFETEEPMVPGDTDNRRDVYERYFDSEPGIESYVTREVSLGPAGGNDAYNATFEKTSKTGTVVFFTTAESLVEADTDHSIDVYMRDLATKGTTTLVSTGETACAPACGNGPIDAGFAAANGDGSRVFFVSEERLTAADTDNSADIYVRDLASETTSLVSAGSASCAPACGNGSFPDVALRGISADGSHAYFTTAEQLAGADTDAAVDIYSRNLTNETTTLVSQGGEGCAPACGNGGAVPVFQGSSENGSRVFFSTDESLVGADGDTATDVYARDLPVGPTILISGGSSPILTASFAAASANGAHVFFTTAEALVPADDDNANDIYEWTGGTRSLVTSAECASECGATFDAASADSETVIFSTSEQLSGEDTDSSVDIYAQEVGGGEPALVSGGTGCACGNGAPDARFDRASADTARVVFTSSEVLSAEDNDSEDDIYARDVPGEETTLVTTSPSYCPLIKGNCGATFVDASSEGNRVFFTTVERFTLEDGDNEVDVYERFLGASPSEYVTRLVSTGNDPNLELGPAMPLLQSTNPASPGASTTPKILGEAEAGSTIKVYTSSNCSGEPVAHGTAEQLVSPGIGVTVEAGETARFWATAEAEGFVSLCSSPISYTQESSPSGGGGGGGGGGFEGGSGGAAGGPKKDNPPPPKLLTYVTPHTRITFAPGSKTRNRNPTFRFTDATGQPGTKFRCKVDRHPWKHCSSPLRLKRLNRGRHLLEIKAVNAVGTPEPQPVKRRFKLVPR